MTVFISDMISGKIFLKSKKIFLCLIISALSKISGEMIVVVNVSLTMV